MLLFDFPNTTNFHDVSKNGFNVEAVAYPIGGVALMMLTCCCCTCIAYHQYDLYIKALNAARRRSSDITPYTSNVISPRI
jgi:hypothetical protein